MTSSTRLSSFFPNSAITRAERTYQQRSAKPARSWRRWVNRAVIGLALIFSLVMFGGLVIGSLTQRDPTPIFDTLRLPAILLIAFTLIYHFYLLFQTTSLAANSIAREKEAQTWDLLVLTGVDARQIVRGKWWATVQQQIPQYWLLGLLRVGTVSAIAISSVTFLYYDGSNFYHVMLLPHLVTIVISSLFSIALPVFNLGFGAACGVMASAFNKRSTQAILYGLVYQAVLSFLFSIGFILILSRIPFLWMSPLYGILGTTATTLISNGYSLTLDPLTSHYFDPRSVPFTPIVAIEADWMIAGLLTIVVYALLIRFALWRAECNAVSTLATPFRKAVSVIEST
ncbi:MAG: hypothetical protein LCI00_09050 [Chloroflexi bacterium]|nr:hypothetical protein [Chloroflexota bacterium]MCC6893130.1 hypothetical protein [Anaerolineae bacterium]